MTIQAYSPMQKILFGPPGSGKSHYARKIGDRLKVAEGDSLQATFHPAYDYGDFVAKLLPMTVRRSQKFDVTGHTDSPMYAISTAGAESTVEYQPHEGHLIRAVAKALEVGPKKNVLLIIDEINRGDCARIFGDMFQLLDRDASGWSAYGVNLSDLAFAALMKALGWTAEDNNGVRQWSNSGMSWQGNGLPSGIWDGSAVVPPQLGLLFGNEKLLHFPPNLSIIGTMNTSDESVYYMDTAFKRRWAFEFVNWNYGASEEPKIEAQRNTKVKDTDLSWLTFLTNLNTWIAKCATQRRVDDKQIGLWFLRPSSCHCKTWALNLPDSNQFTDWNKHFGDTGPLIEPIGDSTRQQQIASGQSVEEAILARLCATHRDALVQKVKDRNKESERNRSCNMHFSHLAVGPKTKKWLENSIQHLPSISRDDIQNKLMHFLWDNVFSRDREPLEDLVFGSKSGKSLRTFDDFVAQYDGFIDAIANLSGIPMRDIGKAAASATS